MRLRPVGSSNSRTGYTTGMSAETRRSETAQWVGSLTLVVFLAAVGAAIGTDGQGAAYAAGRFVGGVGIPLLIAFVVRFAYVKLMRDGRPVLSPAIGWIALPLAALTALGALSA